MMILEDSLCYRWSKIEEMFGVKQQTVKKKLRRIYTSGLFGELKESLLRDFLNLDEDDFVGLQKELEADAQGKPIFRRVGQEIGREWREVWEKQGTKHQDDGLSQR
jgi:hypothetical protein